MTTRNIPIKVEEKEILVRRANREVTPESDQEQKELEKSLEGLKVEQDSSPIVDSEELDSQDLFEPSPPQGSQVPESSAPKVKVKPAQPVSCNVNEYLKVFDVFEKRDGNAILSTYTLPNSDVIERIILVIDRAQDENFTPFVVGNQKYTPLNMVKRAMSIFIKLKLGINPYHEFAMIVMNENNASLLMEFTSDARKLLDCLNRITECDTEDIFDLNTVFNLLNSLPLPQPYGPGLAPSYVFRTIIFYGRSYTVPQINMCKKTQEYFDNPFSVCDIIMTHEPVETSNYCQKIFDILQNLDKKGLAYFFPVGRDLRRMHKCTAKLLAHPLQRPIQKLIKN